MVRYLMSDNYTLQMALIDLHEIKFDPFCLHWSFSPSTVHMRRGQLRGSNSNAGKMDLT